MRLWIYDLAVALLTNLAFLPFYLRRAVENDTSSALPSSQLIYNAIGLPVLLCVLSIILYLRGGMAFRRIPYYVSYFIIPVACLLGVGIGYFNWGISTGQLLTPDGETVSITVVLLALSTGFGVLFWGLAHSVLRRLIKRP